MTNPRIDYAPPVPHFQRRRTQRIVIGIVLLLVLALLAFVGGPRGYSKAVVLYWQHKALNYSAPADQVVYDDDPARVPALLKSPGFRPFACRSYGGVAAVHVAAPCPKLIETGVAPGATLFLHERQNSRGQRRLLIVEGGLPFSSVGSWGQQKGIFVTYFKVFRTGNVIRPLAEVGASQISIDYGTSRPTAGVRWFAGQADADDPSHFTIDYELDGRRSTVDGWLTDDDNVKLQQRRGPN